MKIRIEEIEKAVENEQCSQRSWCSVNTTYYSPQEREQICLKCWLDFCKTNGIEIDYGQ